VTSIDPAPATWSRFSGTCVLDPEKTTVTFRTKAMWILPVQGTAKALNGDAQISPDGTVRGSLVIDAASFDTRNNKRDEHLRSEDFLEVVKYPPSPSRPTVAGQPALAGSRSSACSRSTAEPSLLSCTPR
jgi:polyisoprenoid-binding protein YceI